MTDLLQWAHAQGYSFDWFDDWSVGDHWHEYGEVYTDEDGRPQQPNTCELATLLDADGSILSAIGCIDDADDAYRRVIEEELAAYVFPDWQKAQRRARSTQRARRRSLRRSVAR